jgi:tetratricopeptide (TPR) repeat protein
MVNRISRALSVLGLAVLALTGCSRDDGSLEDAERVYLAGRYDEAVPLLKEYLLRHPDDAGAHFYLGSSYLLQDDPWLTLAEGEIETALALFERSGKVSPIPRFSDTYFELRCYLELAKVYFKLILFLGDNRGSPQWIAMITERCDEILASARQVDPDAPEVKQLEELIGGVRRSIRRRPERPRLTIPQAPSTPSWIA